MKKQNSYMTFMLSVVTVFLCLTAANIAFAQSQPINGTTEDGFSYIITENQVTIVGYVGSQTDLAIPSSVEGFPVVSIGENAFHSNTSLRKVSIHNGVMSIAPGAFFGCSNLVSVDLPNGIEKLEYALFYNCESLTFIDLPESLTHISDSAFAGCTSLVSIIVPKNVVEIGLGAFTGCISLSDLAILSPEVSYGYKVFEGCDQIEKLTFHANESANSFLQPFPLVNLRHVNILPGAERIPDEFFMSYSKLESIVIPDTVTQIGNSAFSNCISLAEIQFPPGLTHIGSSAFSNCSELKKVNFPSTLESIGENAFYECFSITSLNLSNLITKIEPLTFKGCSGVVELILPERLESIGKGAFSGLSGLTDLSIPASVAAIEYDAFDGCTGLVSLSLPANEATRYLLLTDAYPTKPGAFPNLTKVSILNGSTQIPERMFLGCGKLTHVSLPEGLVAIGEIAFSGCTSLQNINLPESVAAVGSGAFDNCRSLTNVVLPQGLLEISSGLFSGCSSLQSVYVSDEVTSIGYNAFYGTPLVFIIYGKEGSPAQEYAQQNEHRFIDLDTMIPVSDIISDELVVEMPVFSNRPLQFTLLPENTSETRVRWYSNNKNIANADSSGNVYANNVGETTIRAQAANGREIVFTLKVVRATYDMSFAKWKLPTTLVYNGTMKSLTVDHLPFGVTIKSMTGHTARDCGNYHASVTFNYDSVYYEEPIMPGIDWSITPKEIEVQWGNIHSRYTGSPPVITAQAWGLASGDSCWLTVSSAEEANAGSYTAEITEISNSNYFVAESNKSTVYIIEKASFSLPSFIAWTYHWPFVYNNQEYVVELHNINSLPTGLTFVGYTGNTATNAGDYTAKAIFDYDTNNYYPPDLPDLNWSINKASFDMSKVRWSGNASNVYDGTEKTMILTGLPPGLHVAYYTGNSATNAGDYKASAVFEYDDINYEQPFYYDLNWSISKAIFDLTVARWDYSAPFVYDGSPKTVTLIDLPPGIHVKEYTNNSFVEVGTYQASAHFEYDTTNYEPVYPFNLTWSITKASIDLSEVKWLYPGPFTYDKTEKKVELTGLPVGVSVESYTGNHAVDAGEHTATAVLAFDQHNFEQPVFSTLTWHIKPKQVDLLWSEASLRSYDGLPSNVTATVSGVEAGDTCLVNVTGGGGINAGLYVASAVGLSNPNYTLPQEGLVKAYGIIKAVYDMSGAKWTYAEPFVYDGTEKTVQVTGLPSGVTVRAVSGNTATNAGVYHAAAILDFDSENYEQPVLKELPWSIQKARFDVSKLRWDYDTPFVMDGSEKLVLLTGLPEGLTVETYTGNKGTDVGDYIASARLSFDQNNFEAPGDIPVLHWSIQPSDPVLLPGDLTGEGTIDFFDLEALINYLVNNVESTNMENANVDGKGGVDILDLMSLVDLLLSQL